MTPNTGLDSPLWTVWFRASTWRIVGEALAIVAVAISAYQIYQASQLQYESALADRRMKMAELVLNSHEAAVN